MESYDSEQTVDQDHVNTQAAAPTSLDAAVATGIARRILNYPGKRKLTSPIWEHCVRVLIIEAGGEQRVVAVCKYCKLEMPADATHTGTKRINDHLKGQCPTCAIFFDPQAKVPNDQSKLDRTNMGDVATHKFSQRRLDKLCLQMIIRDELPFNHVDRDGFKAFVSELNPRYKKPNRKKIATSVYDLFVIEKALIKSVIGDQRVSLTTDTWTSIQNINYMVVTAHFLDNEWSLHKQIINFTPITSHRGDDIGRTLKRCLRDWGIDKVFTITMDNATTNDTTISYIKKTLKTLNALTLDGELLHMRCACHVLNLVVNDGLSVLNQSVECIHNAVKFIHSSPARLDKFRRFAALENKDRMANVPMDVSTRRNSTFKMLDVASKYKTVFDKMRDDMDYCQYRAYFTEKLKDGFRVGPPSDDDWEKSRGFVLFLGKFYEATLKLSASKSVTSHLVFHETVTLGLELLSKMQDNSDPILKTVATAMQPKVNKYWDFLDGNSVNKLIFVANVLDPRWKLQYLELVIETVTGKTSTATKFTGEVKDCMCKLYNEYKGGGISVVAGTSQSLANEEIIGANQVIQKLIRQRKERKQEEISNEVDKYLSDAFESPSNNAFDLLSWWKGNQKTYPVLSRISKDIYAIPSSTVASESAFSLGNRVVDPFRSSLTPKMVDALVCTNDWQRAEGFCFFKEPTEEELEFYKELEQVEGALSQACMDDRTQI